ncbi:MAG: PD40 domain-containing protein [Cytophagales bacterium]|nr:PD40 domain-containing protein [Cytophagales bacterium]
MVRVLVVCILGMWLTAVHAQELVFTTPVPFNNAINTEDEELAPVLAPDGKTMYFIRAFHSGNTGGKLAGSDVWVSRKDAMGFWMPATRMDAAWNNKRSNAVIGVNADNTVVYLLNAYNNKSGISFSKLYGGQWSTPEFIAIPGINKDDFVGFYVSPAFDVIFISMKGKDSYGEEDLYISLKDAAGHWTEPRNLGPTINTSGFEISPFLSADKSKLFFTSNGHGGYGDGDVFVSERLYGTWDIWSVPRNLGAIVNSSGFDSYFSIYGDTIAYYARSAGNKSDIFKTKVSYSSNVLPAGSKFLSAEELNEIYPTRLSMRLDFSQGNSTLTNDQSEVIWFVANRILNKKDVNVLLWVREEEDNIITLTRTTEIIRTMRLVGLDDERVSISSHRIKPDANKQGGVIELLLFK